jgi:hypothetical protein
MNDAGGDELVPARPRDPRTNPARPRKTCEQELEEKNDEIVGLKEQVAKLERLLLPYSPIVPYWGKTPWDKKPEGPEFSP